MESYDTPSVTVLAYITGTSTASPACAHFFPPSHYQPRSLLPHFGATLGREKTPRENPGWQGFGRHPGNFQVPLSDCCAVLGLANLLWPTGEGCTAEAPALGEQVRITVQATATADSNGGETILVPQAAVQGPVLWSATPDNTTAALCDPGYNATYQACNLAGSFQFVPWAADHARYQLKHTPAARMQQRCFKKHSLAKSWSPASIVPPFKQVHPKSAFCI